MGRSNPNRKLGSAEIAAVSFAADLFYLATYSPQHLGNSGKKFP
jgi:hypothetical protein